MLFMFNVYPKLPFSRQLSNLLEFVVINSLLTSVVC